MPVSLSQRNHERRDAELRPAIGSGFALHRWENVIPYGAVTRRAGVVPGTGRITVAELTREEVQHVAALAYLRFSPEELDQLRSQLEGILAHINQLQEIDTAAIPPTAQVIEVTSVLRD